MKSLQRIGLWSAIGLMPLGWTMGLPAPWGRPPVDVAATCGGSAADLFGTYHANRSPGSNAIDHDEVEPLALTFAGPNQVRTDYEATHGGATDAELKGAGTFSLSPLTWTERGTMDAAGKSQAYTMTFKASKVTCTTDTQVSSFTGAYTSPDLPGTDYETYTRIADAAPAPSK